MPTSAEVPGPAKAVIPAPIEATMAAAVEAAVATAGETDSQCAADASPASMISSVRLANARSHWCVKCMSPR